jgi:hypothetical protein
MDSADAADFHPFHPSCSNHQIMAHSEKHRRKAMHDETKGRSPVIFVEQISGLRPYGPNRRAAATKMSSLRDFGFRYWRWLYQDAVPTGLVVSNWVMFKRQSRRDDLLVAAMAERKCKSRTDEIL